MRAVTFLAVLMGLAMSEFPARAAAPAPSVIPLISYPSIGRMGIRAKLGTNPNPFTYLLDTGSFGFFTAHAHQPYWRETIESLTGEQFSAAYGAGSLVYKGKIAHTTVTFTDTGGEDLVVKKVRLGIITNQPYSGWKEDVKTHPVPIPPESGHFFGTMGAGLALTKPQGGSASSVLGQIPVPSGLTQGFIIHTGGQFSDSPTLTIGLTKEAIATFPIIVPMNGPATKQTNDNGTTVNLYPEAQATADYTISANGRTYPVSANLILDTGGEGTHFTDGYSFKAHNLLDDTSNGIITPGGFVSIAVAGTFPPHSTSLAQSLNWQIDPTGTTPFVNEVAVLPGNQAGSLNTGIALFYQYDVMFDSEDGVIGFRPVSKPLSKLILNVTGRRIFGPNQSRMRLSGIAGSPAGIANVSCYNARGKQRQSLSGVKAWRFFMELRPGRNPIHIQATDDVGRITMRQLTIYRRS